LAKREKRDPLSVAQDIASKIQKKDETGFFESVTAVAPGFINFKLSPQARETELKKILIEKDSYGKGGVEKKEKVQVEFISANPTGPLTLANGRGGFLGDVISRVLAFYGHDVEREYYVNDMGNQILMFGKSMLSAVGLAPDYDELYKGAYIEGWAKKHKKELKPLKDNPYDAGVFAAKDFLSQIKKTVIEISGIIIDRWTSEADVHKNGFVEKAKKLFQEKNLTYEADRALWLKTTAFGDDKDRVLITGDGFSTYFLGDAGHYLETKERGFDRKINILGPDHYGYVGRIQAVASIIGLKSEIIVTQAMRLIRAGKEVKMSKRKGMFVTFEELVDEVGSDASRFFFLLQNPESHMDFNLDLAKEKSQNNPVYYAQYAYVRAKSILSKGALKAPLIRLEVLTGTREQELITMLLRFSDCVSLTAKDYRVSRFARYSLDLAQSFHAFYEAERVLTDDPKTTESRLALVFAVKTIFESVFDLMGISKPDSM